MRRHLGCPYANKNVFSNRRNSPSSVSGSCSSGGKCSRSGGQQLRNSGRQNGYRSSGRCMCRHRLNADGRFTVQTLQLRLTINYCPPRGSVMFEPASWVSLASGVQLVPLFVFSTTPKQVGVVGIDGLTGLRTENSIQSKGFSVSL